jgi:hypothetical protein
MPPEDLDHQRGALGGSRGSRGKRLLKRSDWSFKSFADGWWAWHVVHPDGSRQSSTQRFLTRVECVADATLHGYVAWIPEAERRTTK